MENFKFAEQLVQLRRKNGITQEQLADFLGVTKASVSKWENRQSMPDITLLPEIAIYFDMTVDELIGYEAQLSKEQIQKIYLDVAQDFATKDFETARKKLSKLIRKYYSCYPFLLQAGVLILNHSLMADPQVREEMLAEGIGCMKRIAKKCTQASICNDALALQAILELQRGNFRDVIEELEEIASPYRMSAENEFLLLQGYLLAGEASKAKSYTQIMMYSRLLSLLGFVTAYVTENAGDLQRCSETFERIHAVIKAYHIESLHPNAVMQLYYQLAVAYAAGGYYDRALAMLELFVKVCKNLVCKDKLTLHGDEYFDEIDSWLDGLALGNKAPRDATLVKADIRRILDNPVFLPMTEEAGYQNIVREVESFLETEEEKWNS